MRKWHFFIACGLLAAAFSCKSSKKEVNPFLGKWDLIFWNNQTTKEPGTFVFTDSLIYFHMNNLLEISNYTIKNDTLTTSRIGGRTYHLSSYDYWVIDKVDSVFFKLTSSKGNIVTAYKKNKYWGIKDRDSTYIRL